MANELKLGEARVGQIIDFDPKTPAAQVQLELTDSAVEIKMAWPGPDSPYILWFTDNMLLSGISERRRIGPPRQLAFHDSFGSVTLVGCSARSSRLNLGGPGIGTLRARFAILGTAEPADFARPHGVRSRITGLREWLGVSSIDHQWKPTPKSLHRFDVASFESLSLGGGLSTFADWSYERDGDRLIISDGAILESREGDGAASIDMLLEPHRAMRDLLALSRWWPESCVLTAVMHRDDQVGNTDSDNAWWREVVSVDTDSETAPDTVQHLYEYHDLSPDAVGEWIRTYQAFKRAIDPVVSSLASDLTAAGRLAQSGPGVEALGFLLHVRDGLSEEVAGRKYLRLRLERINQDVEAVLPDALTDWHERFLDAYSAVKHANRTPVDELDMLNVWRHTTLVMRAWFGLELGVPTEALRERLARDRQLSLITTAAAMSRDLIHEQRAMHYRHSNAVATSNLDS